MCVWFSCFPFINFPSKQIPSIKFIFSFSPSSIVLLCVVALSQQPKPPITFRITAYARHLSTLTKDSLQNKRDSHTSSGVLTTEKCHSASQRAVIINNPRHSNSDENISPPFFTLIIY